MLSVSYRLLAKIPQQKSCLQNLPGVVAAKVNRGSLSFKLAYFPISPNFSDLAYRIVKKNYL